MSSISSVSGLSNAWANASTQRSQMQAKMFAKVDADSSGGIDATELQSMVSDISKKTGTTLDATKLFSAMDSDGDSSLSSEELASGMQSVMPPPPSTVDFAQTRNDGQDDLFSKVDSNSDGSIDETEMSAFTDKMATETGKDSATSFASLDADSDGKLTQAEFETGRPGASADTSSASTQSASAASGPPPAGGAGGASSASSTTYDPLDTNQDGTVSEMERLAGALKDLIGTSDSSGSSSDTSTKISQNILALAKLVYEQISNGSSDTSSSALSVSA